MLSVWLKGIINWERLLKDGNLWQNICKECHISFFFPHKICYESKSTLSSRSIKKAAMFYVLFIGCFYWLGLIYSCYLTCIVLWVHFTSKICFYVVTWFFPFRESSSSCRPQVCSTRILGGCPTYLTTAATTAAPWLSFYPRQQPDWASAKSSSGHPCPSQPKLPCNLFPGGRACGSLGWQPKGWLAFQGSVPSVVGGTTCCIPHCLGPDREAV